MSKFLKEHPVYARMEAFIEEQVLKCRPSAINIAMRNVAMEVHTSPEAHIQAVAAHVDRMEIRMAKRLRRYYGMTGKYVGH